MTKLSAKDRESFEKILAVDLKAIESALRSKVKEFWDIGRKEIMKKRGWDVKKARVLECEEEIRKLKQEIHTLEKSMHNELLTPEQVVELGGARTNYGAYRGASFYGIPVESQFDYEIVEFIKDHINLEIPAKMLYDLGRSCMRDITMVGIFEEAQGVYDKFYKMDFRKYGVDIPPRLSEIKKEALLEGTKEILKLGVDEK